MILASQRHPSLDTPVLDSLNFLNEVIGRYPNAISFAPGAPNPAHLDHLDVGHYIERYMQHVCHTKNLNREQARRRLYQYGPAQGIINDLVALSIQNDKGFGISPESFVITVGAQEAMFIVLRALFQSKNDRLAVVNPSFVGILGAARLLDINVVGIDETEQGLNLDQLNDACEAARRDKQSIRALYVAPDYSNPAGTLLGLHDRQRLLELAKQHDFLIIEDNAYGFTALPGEEIPTLKALDNSGHVIFIGTYAKICLPGARVGYVIADQRVEQPDGSSHLLAKDLATIKSMITVNTSPICQALIGGMLLEHNGSFKTLEQERSTLYRSNLALLLNALKRKILANSEITWNEPGGGFFVRVRLPVPVNTELLECSASNFGLLWTPMSTFYLNNAGSNELRLSCSYLTPEQIEDGTDRLASFFHYITQNKTRNQQ